jgi:hypothetical protein
MIGGELYPTSLWWRNREWTGPSWIVGGTTDHAFWVTMIKNWWTNNGCWYSIIIHCWGHQGHLIYLCWISIMFLWKLNLQVLGFKLKHGNLVTWTFLESSRLTRINLRWRRPTFACRWAALKGAGTEPVCISVDRTYILRYIHVSIYTYNNIQ